MSGTSVSSPRRRSRGRIVVLVVMAVVAVLIGRSIYVAGGRRQAVPEFPVAPLPGGEVPFTAALARLSPLERARIPLAVRFDAPLGNENGALTYNAQSFGANRHLGDDLNGIGGWNSDQGDPVYAAADGRVVYAAWASEGWGNVVILAHRLPDNRLVFGVYAHLQTIAVAVEQDIWRGYDLGTVGTAEGKWLAHLHFEIRTGAPINPGLGYSLRSLDRLNPTEFLAAHRGEPGSHLMPAPFSLDRAEPVGIRFASPDGEQEP